MDTPATAADAMPFELGALGPTLTALHVGAALRNYFPTVFVLGSIVNATILRRRLF